MAWQPPGGQPSGWQPDGWQSDALSPDSTPNAVIPAGRTYKRGRQSSAVLDAKDPDVSAWYQIDWYYDLVPALERIMDVEVGQVFRAPEDTGWWYRCTVAGRTEAQNPRYPRATSETLTDGSATFETIHPTAAAAPSVQSVTWTVPSGITSASTEVVGLRTRIKLSGGTDEEDYDITCRMTPSDGEPLEQTITVPVRAQ